MIYFVQPADGGPVKIGYSRDVAARVKQLQSVYQRPLVVLATMEGGPADEREIHKRFEHLRFGRTEQFRPAPDLMEFMGRPASETVADVSPMDAASSPSVAHMKGSPAYVDWLERVHKKTRIPKVQIFRIAVEEWAAKNGHELPPII